MPEAAHANARRGDPRLVASAIRMRSLAGRLQWRRPGTIQASCQATQRRKSRKINTLHAARQSVAGPFRSRNLRPAQYLCGAQQLCSSSSKRPHQAQKPMQSKIYLIDITCFLGALHTARNLLLHLRQRRLRLCRIDAGAGGCIPEAQLLRGPPRLGRRDAIPKASNSPSPRARQVSPHGQ